MTDTSTQDPALVETVAEALLVLSNVGYGDLDTRIHAHVDQSSPLGALFAGINEMIDALRAEKQRNQQYQQELEEKLATIEQQRAAIQELSAPIMEVWGGVLCLPIVGVMDSARAAETTDAMLRAVTEKDVTCTIIDITGIEVMDTKTVDHFVKMAQAVELLGATCMLTGVSPSIASTMVEMGLDLEGLKTHRTIREALRSHLAQRKR